MQLLAPEAAVMADAAAVLAGTPERIDGRHEVATFFEPQVLAQVTRRDGKEERRG